MDLLTIVITIAIALVLKLFNIEITRLCRIIRNKPFESFMVIGIGVLITISLYGTFF